MMHFRNALFDLLTVVVLGVFVSGCTALIGHSASLAASAITSAPGLAAGEMDSYAETATIPLIETEQDILDILEEYGESEGFDVKRQNKNELTFISGASFGSHLAASFLAKVNLTTVKFVHSRGMLHVAVERHGNYGVEARPEAEKLMEDIKKTISEKMKNVAIADGPEGGSP